MDRYAPSRAIRRLPCHNRTLCRGWRECRTSTTQCGSQRRRTSGRPIRPERRSQPLQSARRLNRRQAAPPRFPPASAAQRLHPSRETPFFRPATVPPPSNRHGYMRNPKHFRRSRDAPRRKFHDAPESASRCRRRRITAPSDDRKNDRRRAYPARRCSALPPYSPHGRAAATTASPNNPCCACRHCGSAPPAALPSYGRPAGRKEFPERPPPSAPSNTPPAQEPFLP